MSSQRTIRINIKSKKNILWSQKYFAEDSNHDSDKGTFSALDSNTNKSS